MSTVRKASALYPGVPVVIDLSYVSIADFSTAYVSIALFKANSYIKLTTSVSSTPFRKKGFDNLAEDLHKRGHSVVITRSHPRVLTILEGVRGSKLHVHRDGIELDNLLQGKLFTVWDPGVSHNMLAGKMTIYSSKFFFRTLLNLF